MPSTPRCRPASSAWRARVGRPQVRSRRPRRHWGGWHWWRCPKRKDEDRAPVRTIRRNFPGIRFITHVTRAVPLHRGDRLFFQPFIDDRHHHNRAPADGLLIQWGLVMRNTHIVQCSDQSSAGCSNSHSSQDGQHRSQRDNRPDAGNRERDQHRHNSHPAAECGIRRGGLRAVLIATLVWPPSDRYHAGWRRCPQ